MKKVSYNLQPEDAFQNKDFKKAKKLFYKTLVKDSSPFIYLRLAQCHFMLQEYPEAVLMCEKTLELEPDSAKGYAMLSKAHLYQNKVLDAEIEAEKAIMLDNTLHDAYLSFAHVKIIQGDFCAAEKNIKITLEQDPHEWFAHYLLAIICRKTDKKKEALQELRLAYQLNPSKKLRWFVIKQYLNANIQWISIIVALVLFIGILTGQFVIMVVEVLIFFIIGIIHLVRKRIPQAILSFLIGLMYLGLHYLFW